MKIPNSAPKYYQLAQLLRIIAIGIGIVVLLWISIKCEAHVDLTDPTAAIHDAMHEHNTRDEGKTDVDIMREQASRELDRMIESMEKCN